LITQIGEEVPTLLRGDPLRLRQVLLNLVGNAIKFTSCGEVFLDVSLERQDDTSANVRFEVHDSGIGIAEEVIPRLSQPFTQADDSTTRRFGGPDSAPRFAAGSWRRWVAASASAARSDKARSFISRSRSSNTRLRENP